MSSTFDDALLKQGEKMVELNEDSLLEIIGLQLLAIDPPDRAMNVGSNLSAAETTGDLALAGVEKTEALLPPFRIISQVLKQNRRRAQQYLDELLPRIKLAMCDGGKLKPQYANQLEAGELVIKVTAEVVANLNGLPPLFGSLTITIASWVSKRGLDTLCR